MEIESRRVRVSALWTITIGAFLIPFMGSSINIALPSIGKDFAMDAILLGWVTTSQLLAVAIFQVPFGRVADIYGRKKVFLWGFIIFTFFSVLCAVTSSTFLFILFRVLQGIGASMTFSTGMAILMSLFPVDERGKVLGFNVAAVYTGLSCGPVLGGLLVHSLGWRSIFLVNLPVGLVIILFILWKLKGEWTEAKGESFDLAGSVLYGAALLGIIYGLSMLPSASGGVSVLLGMVILFGFVRWEIRSGSPILNIDLLRKNRVFAFSNLAALINYSATFAVTFLLSLYLQYIKGLDPRQAGMILIVQPVVMAIVSPFAGKLSDRIEPGWVASAGMGLTAIGLLFFVFLNERTPELFIVINLVLIGFGFGLFSSPNTNAVMSSVEKRFYGVASGTLGTMRVTGMMFSMGLVMLLFSVYMGRTQITPAIYPLLIISMRVAFGIFGGFCLIGILPSLSRGRVH